MFSDNQRRILTVLMNQPAKEYYLSELGKIIHKHPGVFSRGVNSLEKQGFIVSHRRGNQRVFRANSEHLLFKETKSIIQKTAGVEALLEEIVEPIEGIKTVFIYGSYVKDQMRFDSDIDILCVVNDLGVEDLLLEKISAAEHKLQREINYKIYSQKEFSRKIRAKDPFLEEILSAQYILLKGTV